MKKPTWAWRKMQTSKFESEEDEVEELKPRDFPLPRKPVVTRSYRPQYAALCQAGIGRHRGCQQLIQLGTNMHRQSRSKVKYLIPYLLIIRVG